MLSERTPRRNGTPCAQFLGLGGGQLPDELRARLEALGQVEWLESIYAVAAEQVQRRHVYRALLVDLRALAQTELAALLALGRRTGLPVWLLPVDAGRTRLQAALAGGAIAWTDTLAGPPPEAAEEELTENTPRTAAAPVPTPPGFDMAARLAELLAPGSRPERRNHGPGGAASPEAPAKPEDSATPGVAATPAIGPEPAPPAATSENLSAAKPPQNQVTSAPPPGYDESSPVLSEEELRALLGPLE